MLEMEIEPEPNQEHGPRQARRYGIGNWCICFCRFLSVFGQKANYVPQGDEESQSDRHVFDF